MYRNRDKKRIRREFRQLRKDCRKLFYYAPGSIDSWLIEICLIPYITIGWNTTPTWVRIIGPSSSGKSAHLSLFVDHCQSLDIDDMTPKSLISGFRGGGEDPSHLPLFNGKVLLIQDESTLMEQRAEDRGIVQSILRKAFDGKVTKILGNVSGIVEAEAHFNIIVAATPIIDRYFSYTQVLGERFINFRLQIPNPAEITKRAYDNQRSGYTEQHDLLKEHVHSFLNDFPVVGINDVKVTEEIRHRLTSCADFVVRIRTHISRDGTGKHITMLPRQESAGRLVQQLIQIASACALLHGSSVMRDEFLDRAIYTSISSVPEMVMFSLYSTYLLSKDRKTKWFDFRKFVINTGIGRNTALQLLENFTVLGMIKMRKGSSGIGRSIEYTLSKKSIRSIESLDLFRYYIPPLFTGGKNEKN